MALEDSTRSDYHSKLRTLNLLKNFIEHGEYADKRKGREGAVCRVATSKVSRRQIYSSAIRSYFAYNGPQLPRDMSFPKFKIKTTKIFMKLDTAHKIITCLKEPYHTLATCALYGGLGRKEALSLNTLWKQIHPELQASIQSQVQEGKDPIRVDFDGRKKNPNPYFTFLPASLLQPFADKDIPFLVFSKSKKKLRPTNESDLQTAWSYAKKRAGIQGKQTFHMVRDLFITNFYKIGADVTTSQFLTGHEVDKNRYLQINQAPERAQKEWQKYRQFLDTGIDSEAQEQVEKLRKQMTDDHRRLEYQEAQDMRLLKENESLELAINKMEDRVSKLLSTHASELSKRDERIDFLEDTLSELVKVSKKEAFPHDDPKWQREFEKRMRRFKQSRKGT